MPRPPTQSFVRNCLLSALSADDFLLIAPDLELVVLDKDMTLTENGKPIDYAYFPDRGVGSIIAYVPHVHRVEVGIFGRDGMSSVPLLLGARMPTQTSIMQSRATAIASPRVHWSRRSAPVGRCTPPCCGLFRR